MKLYKDYIKLKSHIRYYLSSGLSKISKQSFLRMLTNLSSKKHLLGKFAQSRTARTFKGIYWTCCNHLRD